VTVGGADDLALPILYIGPGYGAGYRYAHFHGQREGGVGYPVLLVHRYHGLVHGQLYQRIALAGVGYGLAGTLVLGGVKLYGLHAAGHFIKEGFAAYTFLQF
jgi:hypothetical protein